MGSMSTFCQEPASLIMTPSSVEKLLCCNTSWLAQSDHLVTVCNESQVGKAMFGHAWQGVRSEKITNVILEALEVLEKSKITELSFNDYRLKCWHGIKEVDKDLDSFNNLRKIRLEYRGVPVKPLVTR